MNDWLKKLIDQAKGLWARWNTTQKIILFAVIGASILATILLVAFSATPSMEPLITEPVRDEEARMRIVAKLDELQINYQLRADNVFYVADEKTARRVRVLLSEENLIPTGTDPWALFDMERWTTTDFERDVNLQRAITKQLEQHILALDDIDSVSVTLVVPQKELFTEDQNPTTASIIVTPRPGSDFVENRKKIEGVQRLIGLAVAGLKTEHIVITDQSGVQLNDFVGLAEIDRLELAKREIAVQQQLQAQYKSEILQALRTIFTPERVAGPRIDIDLDMSKVASTAEEFTPIIMTPDNPKTPFDESERVPSITRSSQIVEESFQGTGYNPEGPAGVEGQTPPAYKDLSNLVGNYSKSSATNNYEINKTVTNTDKRPWDIKRITIGVALDGVWRWKYDTNGRVMLNPDGSIQREFTAVTGEDIQKAKALIQGFSGFNSARGDIVEVQAIQFDRSKQFELEDAVYRRQITVRRTIYYVLAGIGAALFIALVFRLIVKEMERRRRLREEELARQHQAMREAALRTAEEQGVDVEMSVEEKARMEMQENAVNMAREHPDDVAQLIRTWLVEE